MLISQWINLLYVCFRTFTILPHKLHAQIMLTKHGLICHNAAESRNNFRQYFQLVRIVDPLFLFKDSSDINFSEVRFLEYPSGIRHTGHLINFTRHLQHSKCPLLHWKIGLVLGTFKQTGHSSCPSIFSLTFSDIRFLSSEDSLCVKVN